MFKATIRPATFRGIALAWSAPLALSLGLFAWSTPAEAGVAFRRGDASADGALDITDPIVILNFLFLDSTTRISCPDAADANDDNLLDITDPIAILGYLFLGGSLPQPLGGCGTDPTPSELEPCLYDPRLCPSGPPVISNLRLLPEPPLLPVSRDGDLIALTVTFDFVDPNGDAALLESKLRYPSGKVWTRIDRFRPEGPSGAFAEQRLIDSSYPAGSYLLTLVLEDREKQRSGAAEAAFDIQPGADRPIDILSVVPATAGPGETIRILGTGFDSALEAAIGGNLAAERPPVRVEFSGGAPGRVLSASASEIEVVVPRGALTGPISVSSPFGRAQTPSAYPVRKEIEFSSRPGRMAIGQEMDLSFTASGSIPSALRWSLNGLTYPLSDPRLGTLVPTLTGCRYRSPPRPPASGPVALRGASADDPAVFDEVLIDIVPPALPSEYAEVTRALGGKVESRDGRAEIVFAPNALPHDEGVWIERMDPTALPAPSAHQVFIGLVEVGPESLDLGVDATLKIPLSRWEQPGSSLWLYRSEEGSPYASTGRTMEVDDTGQAASGSVGELGRLAIVKEVPPDYLCTMEERVQTMYLPRFPEYSLDEPPGVEFLEGLSVPVLVKHNGDKPSPEGPFFDGIPVKLVLDDEFKSEFPVSFVQPSADGWDLGLVLDLPILRDCHGQTMDAWGQEMRTTLRIGTPEGICGEGELVLSFRISCLCELDVNVEVPPSPVPVGVDISLWSAWKFVKLDLWRTHRYSELKVGAGATLSAERPSYIGVELMDPLRIEVTGDVEVSGDFKLIGLAGQDGGDGEGNDNGGDAGFFALFHSGIGGQGGPYSAGSNQRNRGESGDSGLHGGAGGSGGDTWDKPSELGAVFDAASLIVDIATGDWIGAAGEAYDLGEEAVKFIEKDANLNASTGEGGHAPAPWSLQDLEMAFFRPTEGGGGGGGSGKTFEECDLIIDWCTDDAGGGGGGGGGGAPALSLVSGGVVTVNEGGFIDARGGNGGRGGDGNDKEAAPGGGGGGGNGGQISISARQIRLNGIVLGRRGHGGLSGEIEGEGKKGLIARGFGRSGSNGILRVNGTLSSEGNDPLEFAGVYAGPRIGGARRVLAETGEEAAVEIETFLGNYISVEDLLLAGHNPRAGTYYYERSENGAPKGVETYRMVPTGDPSIPLDWNLVQGLNTLDVRVNREFGELGGPDKGPFIELHPWERQHVFWFPGAVDSDGDGLTDALERTYGTNIALGDTDHDGFGDWKEVFQSRTDPTDPTWPDLIVSSIEVVPAEPRVTDTIVVRVTIKNQGLGTGGNPTSAYWAGGHIEILQDTTLVYWNNFDWDFEIQPGGDHQWEFQMGEDHGEGSYTINVTVETYEVPEADTTNNEASREFVVRP